jgi:hypothetical protein
MFLPLKKHTQILSFFLLLNIGPTIVGLLNDYYIIINQKTIGKTANNSTILISGYTIYMTQNK